MSRIKREDIDPFFKDHADEYEEAADKIVTDVKDLLSSFVNSKVELKSDKIKKVNELYSNIEGKDRSELIGLSKVKTIKIYEYVKLCLPGLKNVCREAEILNNINLADKKASLDIFMDSVRESDDAKTHFIFWLLVNLYANECDEEETESYIKNIALCAAYCGIEAAEFKEFIFAVRRLYNGYIEFVPNYNFDRTKIFQQFNPKNTLEIDFSKEDEIDKHIEYVEKFCTYLKAKMEIIAIDTIEDGEALSIVEDAGKIFFDNKVNIYSWDVARGLQNVSRNYDNDVLPEAGLEKVLDHIINDVRTNSDNNIYMLRNVKPYLDKPSTIGKLKVISEFIQNKVKGQTLVVIIDRNIELEQSIEKYIYYEDGIGYPNRRAITEIIKNHIEKNGLRLEEKEIESIAVDCKGLTRNEISRLLRLAFIDASDTRKVKKLIVEEKKQLIKKSALVEIIDLPETISVGGLKALDEWLEIKKKIIDDSVGAQKKHVELPKGVFLIGMPGCGKSLSAKYAAVKFKKPLVKIDMGSLMNKYVGESEHNFRDALKIAEAISPCVLWIDEFEKAFPNGKENGSQSESSSRIFAHLLTWMQEKKSMTFVVATANNVNTLPPELLRRGRFDETFFVDLPTEEEIADILSLHMDKRGLVPTTKLIKDIAGKMRAKEYSGSDVEYTVRAVAETKFLRSKEGQEIDVDIKLFEGEMENITSWAQSMRDDYRKLSEYKKNFRNASGVKNKNFLVDKTDG